MLQIKNWRKLRIWYSALGGGIYIRFLFTYFFLWLGRMRFHYLILSCQMLWNDYENSFANFQYMYNIFTYKLVISSHLSVNLVAVLQWVCCSARQAWTFQKCYFQRYHMFTGQILISSSVCLLLWFACGFD